MSHGGVHRDEVTNREESKGLLLARDHDDDAHDHSWSFYNGLKKRLVGLTRLIRTWKTLNLSTVVYWLMVLRALISRAFECRVA